MCWDTQTVISIPPSLQTVGSSLPLPAGYKLVSINIFKHPTSRRFVHAGCHCIVRTSLARRPKDVLVTCIHSHFILSILYSNNTELVDMLIVLLHILADLLWPNLFLLKDGLMFA